MISKINLWNERDKAIAKGLEKFNNKTVRKVASDTQARIGCKGKEKFWYGYKRNISACMKYGFITKVAVTPANIPDSKALKHICPKEGVVFADKGYATKEAQITIKKNGSINKTILKNNMRGKDLKKDALIAKQRMPYESIFSKQSKRVRYKGVAKTQFQAILQALAFNFKRLVVVRILLFQ